MQFYLRTALSAGILMLATLTLAQTRVQAFEAPGKYDQKIARKHKIKVALRFGYLRDNKEAESLRRRTEYNSKGFPILIYDFNATGGIQGKAEYQYETNGKQIRSAQIQHYSENADLQESLFYEFDEDNRLIRYKSVDAKDYSYNVGFTYDNTGRLLSAQQFEVDGLPGAADVYDYDRDGNCTEIVKYAVGKRIAERQKFVFDASNKCIMEERYRGDRLLFRLHNKFDDSGRKIKQLRILSSGQEYGWEEWSYNVWGQIKEHLVMEPGEPAPMREVFSYDDSGRKKEVINYDSDKSIFQWFKYSYDSTGTGVGYKRLNPNGSVDMMMKEVFAKDGRIMKQFMDFEDSGKNEISYIYDEMGMPSKEIHTAIDQEEAVYWFVFERY